MSWDSNAGLKVKKNQEVAGEEGKCEDAVVENADRQRDKYCYDSCFCNICSAFARICTMCLVSLPT